MSYIKRLIEKQIIIIKVQGFRRGLFSFFDYIYRKFIKIDKKIVVDYDRIKKNDKDFFFEYILKNNSNSCKKVSVIIPTKDKVEYLKSAIDSVLNSNYSNYEIIIINNNSVQEETFIYLESLTKYKNIKIITLNEKFNFSHLNNIASDIAEGELLLFLNNDIQAINNEWLSNLTCLMNDPQIGIVGAELLFPDNTIQHGGIAYNYQNISNITLHQFFKQNKKVYENLVPKIRFVSAVTGACLMISRDLFFKIGKFDENLPIVFQDVDLCFKCEEAGQKVLITNFSQLYHYESISRKGKFSQEEYENWKYFVLKWNTKFRNEDKYFKISKILK